MEPLICPDCRQEHREPLDAGLGHRLPCADCRLAAELADPASIRAAEDAPPLAA